MLATVSWYGMRTGLRPGRAPPRRRRPAAPASSYFSTFSEIPLSTILAGSRYLGTQASHAHAVSRVERVLLQRTDAVNKIFSDLIFSSQTKKKISKKLKIKIFAFAKRCSLQSQTRSSKPSGERRNPWARRAKAHHSGPPIRADNTESVAHH